MLNSREMATLCWLGIAVLWLLNKKKLRRDISRLLKLFLQPPIIISLLAMFAWIGCELVSARKPRNSVNLNGECRLLSGEDSSYLVELRSY